MRAFQLLTIITTSCLLLYSCERDEPIADTGGKGGNAVLKVIPRHHSLPIDSCMVYIKYNSLDASTVYDDSIMVTEENGNPTATFSGLKKGKYYLYGKGWDSSIDMAVIGGLPHTITMESTHNISLPVTEGD